MRAKARSVQDYLEELDKSKSERAEQVREGLDIYIGLWRKAITNGVVSPSDDVEYALERIEEKGGLYQAAEE